MATGDGFYECSVGVSVHCAMKDDDAQLVTLGTVVKAIENALNNDSFEDLLGVLNSGGAVVTITHAEESYS